MRRRALLAVLGAFGVGSEVRAAKRLESAELLLTDLALPGDLPFGRALLAVPRVLPERPELLVLLHGLLAADDVFAEQRATP